MKTTPGNKHWIQTIQHFQHLLKRRTEGIGFFCPLCAKYETRKDKAVCEGTPEVVGEVFTVENVMEVQGKPQVSICKATEQI